MPIGIASSDKKLLLGGAALILIFLIATAVLSPPQEQMESPVPSTYSTQSAGAAAAYRLLTNLHYPVRRWENPPTELYGVGADTLLILAEPSELPNDKERKALADFVEDGGHVLFTGPKIDVFFAGVMPAEDIPDPAWKTFAPSLPTRITRGAQRITLQHRAHWQKLAADQFELYGDSGSSVVVSWTLGNGEILWWAGSTPLSNAGITREDNLAFFLNSVGNWHDQQPYQIYWDEYFHGQRSNLWSYVQKTSLSWGTWQIAILAVAVLFTFSRRSGPTFVPAEVSRLSPLEFVDTLGGLYERAKAGASAISVSSTRLRTLLSRQLGLPVNTPSSELADAAALRLGWRDSGLGRILAQTDVAIRAGTTSSREALQLVQKLEEFASKLDIRAQSRREKT